MKRSASAQLVPSDDDGKITMGDLPAEIKRIIADFVAQPQADSGKNLRSRDTFVQIPDTLKAVLPLRAVDKAWNEAVMTPERTFGLKAAIQEKAIDRQLKNAKGYLQAAVDATARREVPAHLLGFRRFNHMLPVPGDRTYQPVSYSMLDYANAISNKLTEIGGGVSEDIRNERMNVIMARMGLDDLLSWGGKWPIRDVMNIEAMTPEGWQQKFKNSLAVWFSTLEGVDYYNMRDFRNLADRTARTDQEKGWVRTGTEKMEAIRERFVSPPSLERPFVAQNIADALVNPNFTRLYAPPGTTLPPTARPYVDPPRPRVP